MNKQQRSFKQIETYKNRFRRLETNVIRKRMTESSLIKEAEIALKQVLEERENN